MLDIGLIDVFAEGNEQASFPRLRFAEHGHSERINALHGGQRAIRRFWRQLAAVRAMLKKACSGRKEPELYL